MGTVCAIVDSDGQPVRASAGTSITAESAYVIKGFVTLGRSACKGDGKERREIPKLFSFLVNRLAQKCESTRPKSGERHGKSKAN